MIPWRPRNNRNSKINNNQESSMVGRNLESSLGECTNKAEQRVVVLGFSNDNWPTVCVFLIMTVVSYQLLSQSVAGFAPSVSRWRNDLVHGLLWFRVINQMCKQKIWADINRRLWSRQEMDNKENANATSLSTVKSCCMWLTLANIWMRSKRYKLGRRSQVRLWMKITLSANIMEA